MEKGLPRVSTNLLGASASSEASEESEVDGEEGRGVSAGETSTEDATLLAVVEVAPRRTAAPSGSAVVDII